LSSITGIAINKERSSVDMPLFFVNIFIASIGLLLQALVLSLPSFL
jgi:hypothetical protein